MGEEKEVLKFDGGEEIKPRTEYTSLGTKNRPTLLRDHAAKHCTHTSSWSPLATYPYTRHAATEPELYNESNQ